MPSDGAHAPARGARPGPTVLWQRLDTPGLEHCSLAREGVGHRLRGTVVALLDGAPLRAEYDVRCGGDWTTREVHVALAHGARTDALTLVRDGAGRWWRDGVELPEVAGCADVDLAVTPATNTLPIRRLALAEGERREVTAAWVGFPDLAVEPLLQRYTRTGARRYRYESGDGAFVAEIDVDEDGLVVEYPPLFTRVGGGAPHAP